MPQRTVVGRLLVVCPYLLEITVSSVHLLSVTISKRR